MWRSDCIRNYVKERLYWPKEYVKERLYKEYVKERLYKEYVKERLYWPKEYVKERLYKEYVKELLYKEYVKERLYWPKEYVKERLYKEYVKEPDTPQFRGGNPYFFRENPYQSVSFIYASMYSENVHAIHTIRLMHEFSKERQPLHCDVIIGKQ